MGLDKKFESRCLRYVDARQRISEPLLALGYNMPLHPFQICLLTSLQERLQEKRTRSERTGVKLNSPFAIW